MPTPASSIDDITVEDGLRVRVRTWEPAHPSPLPTVFLHHGFIATSELNWNLPGVVDVLLNVGRRVVAHDAIGHGESDRPHDPKLFGEARMARDFWAVIGHSGAEIVDLVGYSMGAVVTLLTASMHPDRVRRVVVGGVGAGVVEMGGVDRSVLDPEDVVQALETDGPSTVTKPQALAFRHFADLIGADRLALAAQARAVHGSGIPLSHITMPVLLVTGADDHLARRPEVLAAALPRGTPRVIAGDHLGAVGNPEFARAIRDFLAER